MQAKLMSLVALASLSLSLACSDAAGTSSIPSAPEAGADAGADAEPDRVPVTAPDAGPGVDAGVDASAGQCHARPNSAPPINVMQVAATRPPFTGGTIADGVYHRTEAREYTVLAAPPVR